jgi:hypothetical protein
MARDERLSANDLRTFLAFSVLGLDGGLDDALIAELAQATGLTPGIVRGCILALASFGYISFSTEKPAADPRRNPARARGLDSSLMEVKVDLARLKRIGDASARDAAALRDARAAVSLGLPEFRPVSSSAARTAPAAPPATDNDVPGDRILRGLSDWNPVDGEAGQPVAVRFSVWLRFVLTPDELDSWELWMAASPGEWVIWAGRYAKAKATGEDKELLQALRQRLGEIASAPPIPGGPGSLSMGPAD